MWGFISLPRGQRCQTCAGLRPTRPAGPITSTIFSIKERPSNFLPPHSSTSTTPYMFAMKATDENQPVMEISALPDISREKAGFLDASFFRSNGASSHPRFPTPTEISQDPSNDNRKVVIFESLNLAVKVKHKSTIKLEEVQAMIAIRRAFPNGEVPVPEVFGWRQHNEKIYIYQSLSPGTSLKQAWPSLTKAEKVSICGELSKIVAALRLIKQNTPHYFIGTVTLPVRFYINHGANSLIIA